MMSTADAIRLPRLLDRAGVQELRSRIEHAGAGASIVLDAADVHRIATAGVQLLCALVLGAEGRGVRVRWIQVSAMLVNYVNLLGIGDIIRFDGPPREDRESVD